MFRKYSPQALLGGWNSLFLDNNFMFLVEEITRKELVLISGSSKSIFSSTWGNSKITQIIRIQNLINNYLGPLTILYKSIKYMFVVSIKRDKVQFAIL